MKAIACLVLLAGALAVLASGCSSSDSNPVDKGAICNKCKACFSEDPNFQEGFCDAYWNGTTFDVDACTKNGNESKLDSHPSANDLVGMTCTEFDNAI